MSRRDLFRLLIALVHLLGTVVSLALIFVVLNASPDRPNKRESLDARSLPEALPWGEESGAPAARRVDRATPPSTGASPKDAAALEDPRARFRESFRVVLASLDREPEKRSCILVPAGGGEQRVLLPGERLSGYVLLSIDPVPGEPRRVRLGFREEDRSQVFEVVLDASP